MGFAANDRRKNRVSHLSQRNGLTKIMARIALSKIPVRFERWIRLLRQWGQIIIRTLRMPFGHLNLPTNFEVARILDLSSFAHSQS